MDDLGLVQEFARNRSEDAFRQLVDRHLRMVFSAACRMVRDPHLAEEVAQNVFTTLAEKAGTLAPPQIVAGWLYQTTRHHAMHAVRSEQRRRQREEQGIVMQTSEDAAEKELVLEHLEAAMAQLSGDDRDVLVLRYLESRNFREVGEQLGISEDAARMRSVRALEQLRGVMGKEGITVTSALLLGTLTTGTALAVPASLGVTIVSTVLTGASVAVTTTGGAATLMKLFTLKTAGALVGAGAVAVATVYFVTQHQKASPSNNQPMIVVNQTSSVPPGPNASKGAVPSPLANISGKQVPVISGSNATNQNDGPKKGKGEKQADPNTVDEMIEEARKLLKARKFKEARNLLNRVVRMDPLSADAFQYRGDAFNGLQQFDKSLTNYSRTIELRPTKADGWYSRGRTYEKLGYYKSALPDYDEAIKLNPELWVAYLGRGVARYHQGMRKAAAEDLERALEYDPNNEVATNLLAKINNPQNPFETLEKSRKAIAANPTNAEAHHLMGETLRMLGRSEEALPCYTKALELDPRPEKYWSERGRIYEHLERWKEAAADYSEYLRIKPGSHVYLAYRGNVYFRDGKYEKALADLDRAITIQPARGWDYITRARIYLSLEKPAKALADCEKARLLLPQDNLHAMYWRARAYEALAEPRQAIEDYGRIIADDESWLNSLHRRGEQYFRLGDYSNAMRDFQRAMVVKRDNADAPFMAGRCAVQMGQDKEALTWFSKVSTTGPNAADPYEYRGNAYAGLKRWTNGIADYTEAIRKRPELGRLYLNRGMINLCLGRMEAARADGLKGLTCSGMSPAEQCYFVLMASSAQRDLGNGPEARKILQQAHPGTNGWPAPIVQHLRGEIKWETLLKSAPNNAEQSEARAYVGWAEILEGKRDEGNAKLRWVAENAAQELYEYDLARYLLERTTLAARTSEKKP